MSNLPPQPPTGAYPPPPGQPYQPPAAPKKSRKTLWIVLGVVGALLVLCCGGGAIYTAGAGKKAVDDAVKDANAAASAAASGQPAPPKQAEPKKATAGINQEVRDGKFAFTVTKVEHGVASVGPDQFGKKAQGQFVLVTLAVKNIGSEAKTFDGSSQYAYGDGVKYSHDGTAEIYANTQNQTFLNGVNPGNTATGVLVFDIPAGKKITSLELHDSPFSGGVTVSVA